MSAPVQQAPGLWRTDLQQHDLSVPGRQVIQNRVELSPEAPSVRHKHPGEEIIYVLEGSLEYRIDGQPAKTYNAGEALMVPAETVHSVRNVVSGAQIHPSRCPRIFVDQSAKPVAAVELI